MSDLDIIKNLVITLISFGNLIVNPLTLLGILRSKTQRREILTPITVSIFVGDIVFGLFMATINTYLAWTHNNEPPLWLVRVFALYMVSIVSSTFNVFLLSLWQTICLLNPLTFASFATKKRIWTGLVLSWILSLFLTILRLTSEGFFYNKVAR